MHRCVPKSKVDNAENTNIEALEADCAYLDKLCKGNQCESRLVRASLERAEIYGLQSKNFHDEIRQSLQERAAAKLSATQNVGAGIFVGGLKLTQGIVSTIPGYYRSYNGNTNRAARVTNSDIFVGSVVSIPACGFALADTLRIQVQGEINRYQLVKAGQLPRQLVPARLDKLDDMERCLTLSKTTLP